MNSNMSSSETSPYSENWIPHGCSMYIFLGGRLDRTSREAYAVLILLIVMSIITFPVTAVLNTLLMVAEKTKPRLKTMSNVGLSCLAMTDGLMGAIGQPIFVALMINQSYAWFNSTCYHPPPPLGGLFPSPGHTERDNCPPPGLLVDHK